MSTPGITVTLAFTLREDFAPEFCASLPEMFKDTAKRQGFRNIRAVQHKDRPNEILLVEEWDSEEDYFAYIAWRRARGDMDRPEGLVLKQQLDIWPTIVAKA